MVISAVVLSPRPCLHASQVTHTQFRGSHSSSTHWRWYKKWVRSWISNQNMIYLPTDSEFHNQHSWASTSFDELLRITPQRHPFSASAALRGTLLCLDRQIFFLRWHFSRIARPIVPQLTWVSQSGQMAYPSASRIGSAVWIRLSMFAFIPRTWSCDTYLLISVHFFNQIYFASEDGFVAT